MSPSMSDQRVDSSQEFTRASSPAGKDAMPRLAPARLKNGTDHTSLREPCCSLLPLFAVLPPWDLLRGLDVFSMRDSLEGQLSRALWSHFAPNCATFSRAREIPIPGARFSPKPLRSSEFPEGLPGPMSQSGRTRVRLDTLMAVHSAESCIRAHQEGKVFSLEHTGRSIALDLESWKVLRNTQGVFTTFYHAFMFEPGSRRKYQVLIHNSESLLPLGRLCKEIEGRCCRTGKPHDSFKARVIGGKTEYATGQEREYPKGFCDAYASCLRSHLSNSPKLPNFAFGDLLWPKCPPQLLSGKRVGGPGAPPCA